MPSEAAKQQVIEERALGLLLAHLTPTQQKSFLSQGFFEFKSKNKGFGETWRLYSTEGMTRRKIAFAEHRLIAMDNPAAHGPLGFYVWGYDQRQGVLPECDTLLALKLAVEAAGMQPTGCTAPHSKVILDQKLSRGKLHYDTLAKGIKSE